MMLSASSASEIDCISCTQQAWRQLQITVVVYLYLERAELLQEDFHVLFPAELDSIIFAETNAAVFCRCEHCGGDLCTHVTRIQQQSVIE